MFFSSGRIDSAVERSALIRGALSVARRAHAGQQRETGNGEIAFIHHPLEVAERVAVDEEHPNEALAAALLHDTVEHAGLDPAMLRRRFGDTVGEIVEAMTEDQEIEDFEERKEEHRERVAAASPEARAVFAADKTANVATLREAYIDFEENVDEGLPVSLDSKITAWEYDLEMLFDHSPGVLLVDRLADELVGLWGQRAQAVPLV